MEGVWTCPVFLAVAIAFSPLYISLSDQAPVPTPSTQNGPSNKTILQTAIERWKPANCEVLPKQFPAISGSGSGDDVTSTTSDYSWLTYCNISAKAEQSKERLTLCQALANMSSDVCSSLTDIDKKGQGFMSQLSQSTLRLLVDKNDTICQRFKNLNLAVSKDENLAKKLAEFDQKYKKLVTSLMTFECSAMYCKGSAANACKSVYMLSGFAIGYLKFTDSETKKSDAAPTKAALTGTSGQGIGGASDPGSQISAGETGTGSKEAPVATGAGSETKGAAGATSTGSEIKGAAGATGAGSETKAKGAAGATGAGSEVKGAAGATGTGSEIKGPAGATGAGSETKAKGTAGGTGTGSEVKGTAGGTGTGSEIKGPAGATGTGSEVKGTAGGTGTGSEIKGPAGATGTGSEVKGTAGGTGTGSEIKGPAGANGTDSQGIASGTNEKPAKVPVATTKPVATNPDDVNRPTLSSTTKTTKSPQSPTKDEKTEPSPKPTPKATSVKTTALPGQKLTTKKPTIKPVPIAVNPDNTGAEAEKVTTKPTTKVTTTPDILAATDFLGIGDPDIDLEDESFYSDDYQQELDSNQSPFGVGEGFLDADIGDTPEKSIKDDMREPIEPVFQEGNKKPKLTGVDKASVDTAPGKEDADSSHFMAYFLTIVVVCIVGYVLFHNKQKIIAFILEGRSTQRRRQAAAGGPEYRKLSSNVDEALPAADKKVTTQNYIY